MATASSTTVAKAFRILQLFQQHAVLTTSLCEESLGIPRATAHRLLISLRDAGAVDQTRHGHYRLSLSLFELGALVPERRGLGDRCGTDLEALADATGYRVHLGVRHLLKVVYLEAAHGLRAQAQGVRTRTGHCGPLHATALGKVLLAYSPPEVLTDVLAQGLHSYTPSTPGKAALLDELTEIRATGVTFVVDQYVMGTASLAVPVRDMDGTVRAGLSIVGDTASMARNRGRLTDEARRTAARVETGAGATFRHRTLEPLVMST